MKIWLLTHSEELKKESGTGKLVKSALADQCHVIVWARKEPDPQILALDPLNTAIVYLKTPTSPRLEKDQVCDIQNIIILDGTWQQARKMYNQSPYLARFPHYEIQGENSVYTKRRNQKESGLCTAEVAIHLLKEANDPQAAALQQSFLTFNQ
ncbi:DTW domain-containing protein [Marinomonas pollencensis]|uniref:tRNA-uridine aminocarboxypropyltransferase n=1 Tax=Marinomonas pollencensis TaxID=491954 RepID=A0A3E0DNC6_9GAMM|nr:tRNA-uridine aminocarboxypropyltransferase [Marinomonas pollencensis]REG82997.1 DTW domain-containing protein [Marinomonas pollencensis]